MKEHKRMGPFIHALQGLVVCQRSRTGAGFADGTNTDLGTEITHDAEAREDSGFLVMILWPAAADEGPGGPNTGERLRSDSNDSV